MLVGCSTHGAHGEGGVQQAALNIKVQVEPGQKTVVDVGLSVLDMQCNIGTAKSIKDLVDELEIHSKEVLALLPAEAEHSAAAEATDVQVWLRGMRWMMVLSG